MKFEKSTSANSMTAQGDTVQILLSPFEPLFCNTPFCDARPFFCPSLLRVALRTGTLLPVLVTYVKSRCEQYKAEAFCPFNPLRLWPLFVQPAVCQEELRLDKLSSTDLTGKIYSFHSGSNKWFIIALFIHSLIDSAQLRERWWTQIHKGALIQYYRQ